MRRNAPRGEMWQCVT